MRYVVHLPLPPKQLSPNFRGHTRAKAPWVAKYREACFLFYKAAKIPPLPTPITLHLDFYCAPRASASGQKIKDNCYRPRDADSARACFKAGQDALQDAGIVPNDSAKYVQLGTTKVHTSVKAHGGKAMVVLTIETP